MDEQTPPPASTSRLGTSTEQRPETDEADSFGPRVTREQVLDAKRLRRSGSDRYVAGVAGGLARHLDVDPLLVRIVLAVLTLFGAAGLVVYVDLWLLVPVDGSERAVVPLRGETLRAVLLGVFAVAALLVLGLPWGDSTGSSWTSFPLLVLLAPLVLLVGGVVWLITRRRPATGTQGAYGSPDEPAARRTGVVLFWPTLALVAIVLGVVGLVDVSYDVPVSAYAAAALAVTALALVLGSFRGRPGGLIALGLVLTLALGVASATDAARAYGPYSQTELVPVSTAALEQAGAPSAASLPPSTALQPESGDFTLDLRALEDLEALDGRVVSVRMDVGALTVLLPGDLGADVDARLRFGGEIDIDGELFGDGFGESTVTSYPVVGRRGEPVVRLALVLGAGEITVVQDVDAASTRATD